MQEMAPSFQNLLGACSQTALAISVALLGQSLAALSCALQYITLQLISQTWQA